MELLEPKKGILFLWRFFVCYQTQNETSIALLWPNGLGSRFAFIYTKITYNNWQNLPLILTKPIVFNTLYQLYHQYQGYQ